jgi:hypothetical protein
MHVQPLMVKRAWGEGGGGNNKDEVGGAIDMISSAKGPSPSQWNVIVGRRERAQLNTPICTCASNMERKGETLTVRFGNKMHAGGAGARNRFFADSTPTGGARDEFESNTWKFLKSF